VLYHQYCRPLHQLAAAPHISKWYICALLTLHTTCAVTQRSIFTTGTIEEKIFQRQLSKEGLQSIVDDQAEVNSLSSKDLRNLFKITEGTPCDTHDKLQCKRCRMGRYFI
jgi:hypothetical protein